MDDILVIDADATSVLHAVNGFLPLKVDKNKGEPGIYLGSKLSQAKVGTEGVRAWGMSLSKYVQESVRNVEKILRDDYPRAYRLPRASKAKNPLPGDYEPELDESTVLDPGKASFYQSLIGMARWMIELGRIDIATEVSLLLSHSCMPREGHLYTALHLFGYLKAHHNARLLLDPRYPDIDNNVFPEYDWEHV